MPEELWDHDEFLEDVRKTCELQNVPMTTVHSEFSPGQYEINLHHVDDPVTACDHGILLKRIIKGVARKHGMAASFMAKPFAEIAGCGLHIHFSLYDKAGENIFADEALSSNRVFPTKCVMPLADWLILWRMRWQFCTYCQCLPPSYS